MGISASQARLLTITARLTSNEYESQQISNAKMRLATQSQEASSEYIAALNTTQLQFMTYDSKGSAITTDLTANSLYQYADMKNQYALVNASGQMIVSSGDAKKFQNASNLNEFLESYGITKVYKSDAIAENVKKLESNSSEGGVKDYYDAWEAAVNEQKKNYTDDDYANEKALTNKKYTDALKTYEDAVNKVNSGLELDTSGLLENLTAAKVAYSNCITYDNWIKSKAAYTTDDGGNKVETEEYTNVQKYYELLEETLAEAENLGCTTIEDTYTYSDESKAQWYTNLWYRLNGESSDKSTAGENGSNYAIMNSKLGSSSDWLKDALTQGLVTLEVASNKDATNDIPDMNNPLSVNLRGISWTTTVYSSVSDITQQDDNAAIAKAEAEYNKKNNEISAKDKKYENKIKTLDTEHTSLQTEYESVQSAMNKNIDRSYKTFSG